ncbi:MAG: hypothetical protein Kow00100_25070 [Geothermobacteraceae bacterium]
MKGQHYDLALVGDAPGGRIAAILAARAGLRVLHLTGFGWPSELFWFSSPLCEHLLDRIDARTCLIPALPVQFRRDELCIQFHGETTLRDELRRELPERASALEKSIETFAEHGRQLQQLVMDRQLAPTVGPVSRLRWKIACLGRGLPTRSWQSFDSRLKSVGLDEVGSGLLADLAATVCLREPNILDTNTAALALSQLLDGHQVAPTVLEGLLSRRLMDAGADSRSAFDLTAIHSERQGFRICFGETVARAESVALAGAPGWIIDGLPASDLQYPRPALWHLAGLTDGISRILAPRILLAGTAGPIQVVIGRDENETRVRLRTGFGLSETVELRSQTDILFPFVDYTPVLRETALPFLPNAGPLGLQGRNVLRGGVRVAAGHLLYPGLGMTGEALAALSLLRQLGLAQKTGKSG